MTEIDMNNLVIEAWDVDRPIDAPNNNKNHTDETVGKLAKSMNSLGQIQPIIVDNQGEIIAGHGRRAAAKSLGWSKIKVIQVPVDAMTARKMRLADNLTSNQNYKTDVLGEEITEIVNSADESLNDLKGAIGLDDRMLDTLVPDLSDALNFDEDAISDNLMEDVADFQEEGDQNMANADKIAISLQKSLGFRTTTPAQARTLKRLIAHAIDQTEISDPATALCTWIEETVR